MDEKTFYTDWYSKKDIKTRTDSLALLWEDEVYPERQEVLSRMGGIEGKSILCIGNGAREKELFFDGCDTLVITDIAVNGISKVKNKRKHKENVLFCAVDALNMPFRDSSFDIVYGWQMTHHIADLDPFFSEIKRVLSPGGTAVFVDNAYSPAWQFVKWKVMKKVTDLFLRKRGVSDRDMAFSLQGDYKEKNLSLAAKKEGFSDFRSERYNFLSYIF